MTCHFVLGLYVVRYVVSMSEATSPGAGSFSGESLYSFNFHPLTAVVKSSLANSNTTICVTRRLRPRTSCILIILTIAGRLWYPQKWQSATCEVTGHKSPLNFRHQWIPTESAFVYWKFSRVCIHDRPFSEVEVATALLSKRHLGGDMISYVDHWYATFGLQSKVGAGEGEERSRSKCRKRLGSRRWQPMASSSRKLTKLGQCRGPGIDKQSWKRHAWIQMDKKRCSTARHSTRL